MIPVRPSLGSSCRCLDADSRARRSLRLAPFIAAALLLAAFAQAHGQTAGDKPTGFMFLTIGGGARAVGLAETMVADGKDPFVIEYNPAALIDLQCFSAAFSHSVFIQDTRGEYIAAVAPSGGWGFGARMAYMGTGDIPRRTGPSEQPLGTYSAANAVFQGALARNVDDQLAVGLSFQYVMEHIDVETAKGFTLGIGMRYRLMSHVIVGASFVNVGPPAKFVDAQFKMPNLLRFGGQWTKGPLSARGEIITGDKDNVKWHLGSEYDLDPRLTLRAGVKLGYDAQLFAAGLSIRTPDGRFGVDYAFAPYRDQLGTTHRFGLTIRP